MKASTATGVPSLVAEVACFLAARGGRAYAVGGYVRDLLLGREPHDVDIALAGDDPLATTKALADGLGGTFFVLDAARGYARALVPLPGADAPITLDVTPIQGSLDQDLARRDFTVDAMALPLGDLPAASLAALGQTNAGVGELIAQVIDPWGGRRDMERRLVRVLGEAALVEDPGRLLRAVRLAGEIGFEVEEETARLIRAHATDLRRVSPERVRDELCRTLALPRARPWLWEMDRLGLLTEVLPEMAPARGVEQPREHYWDVFSHLVEAVGAFERMADAQERSADPVLALVPWHPALDSYFDQEVAGGRTRRTLTKLACLLHDVAKPQTKVYEPSGRMRFFGHAEQGAQMARSALERLCFSRREVAFVAKAVEEHLRPMQLSQNLETPTRRALYRYFRDLEEAALATLYLSLADYLAARGPRLEMEDWRLHAASIGLVVAAGCEAPQEARQSLVDGHLLMRELGLEPGSTLGRLLATVREAIAVGDVTTVEEALALARHVLAEEQGPAVVKQEG
ncbi:MAG: HD domain-containing protein [Chloroflexi bacterium]|nr:HD domain-containing protein [Chloroflexota bacterium]